MNKARVIAFYLPQFHPIPENDKWWGKGFTEWTNAAKAHPLFYGHYQPHLPADLGFYDLRVPETREDQAQLAKQYGVEAFCYYHYWFAGSRIIERPFNEVLSSGKPDFPFCLCWANATWSGIWHGNPDRVLVEQTYPGINDYEAHFKALLPAFQDSRYLRVEGKPIFLVFKPKDIPDIMEFTATFRRLAESAGLGGIYLVGVSHHDGWNPDSAGFDAAVVQNMPGLTGKIPWTHPILKLKAYLRSAKLTVVAHREILKSLVPAKTRESKYIPCLITNWDNSPRSGMNALVITGSTPALFSETLRKAVDYVIEKPADHRLIFVKSWNEWAEGNHLEPDRRFGHGYLEVVRQEICGTAASVASGEFDSNHVSQA